MLAMIVRILLTVLAVRALLGLVRAMSRRARTIHAPDAPPRADARKPPPREVIDAEFEDLEGGR
jgi:hypothetical protein